ncbi:hypothetical protein PF010_g10179 [Phytophthora fragariae]|uniref:Uncharacterized protein n=1 Tax=Phytophthora fragariae TaxID=53985 RepID=A0A6A3KU58_9STRA|nr:hypothetical protein PF011_g11186 [Phytophthora fragariae]KAE9113188.1 hypothetical protein PF010_g10179 [Phytophthora fragariae]KAE9233054.1 hypothetical protein PF004_g9747 [Phytophthora fragariae]KAE9342848.1 hypothetical protein PF008_g9970 [Phytophthora fragariae]
MKSNTTSLSFLCVCSLTGLHPFTPLKSSLHITVIGCTSLLHTIQSSSLLKWHGGL